MFETLQDYTVNDRDTRLTRCVYVSTKKKNEEYMTQALPNFDQLVFVVSRQ